MLTGCTGKKEQNEAVKQVCTQVIKSSWYSDQLTLSGNVVPTQTVEGQFVIRDGDKVAAEELTE